MRIGKPNCIFLAEPLAHLREGPGLVVGEVEDDLRHRSPPTKSTCDGSAASLALRRSRNAGTPSRSDVSTFGRPRSPGNSSFMGCRTRLSALAASSTGGSERGPSLVARNGCDGPGDLCLNWRASMARSAMPPALRAREGGGTTYSGATLRTLRA